MRIVMVQITRLSTKGKAKRKPHRTWHEVVDKGTNSIESVDYPTMQLKFALILRRMVALAYSSVNWYRYEHNCQ